MTVKEMLNKNRTESETSGYLDLVYVSIESGVAHIFEKLEDLNEPENVFDSWKVVRYVSTFTTDGNPLIRIIVSGSKKREDALRQLREERFQARLAKLKAQFSNF